MTGAERLIVRGGVMAPENVQANIEDVMSGLGRPGLCVMVASDTAEIRDTSLVPNSQVCLTTERLLHEHGLSLGLEPTHDLGNPNQFTLWLPMGSVDTLVTRVREAFRGPFRKKDLSDACATEDLRGLQHPGS